MGVTSVLQCQSRPDGSLVARLTLPPSVSTSYSENDVLLLSKDNPDVSEAVHNTMARVSAESMSCASQVCHVCQAI